MDYKVFSSDEYRGKLLVDVNAQDDNNLVFTTMHKDIENVHENWTRLGL